MFDLQSQVMDFRKLREENKKLKDRIETQDMYQRRKMEKEKKEKRARSGSRSSIGGISGENNTVRLLSRSHGRVVSVGRQHGSRCRLT